MKQLGSDNCLQPDNIHYVMTLSFIEAVFEQTYVSMDWQNLAAVSISGSLRPIFSRTMLNTVQL